MNKLFLFLALALTALAFGCKKSSVAPNQNQSPIVGNWQLKQQFTYTYVNNIPITELISWATSKSNPQITFSDDGTLTASAVLGQSGAVQLGTTGSPGFVSNYTLKDSVLTLTPFL